MMSNLKKLNESRRITLPAIKLSDLSKKNSARLLRSEFQLLDSSSAKTVKSVIFSADATSPVGYTLKQNVDHIQDVNRSTLSESFNTDVDADVLNIRIFFPNGKAVQFSVKNGMHVCSFALLDLMAEHLQIDSETASDAFALWLISPLLEVQLKPHHVPFEVYEKWPIFLSKFTIASEEEIALDEPLLVIRRNFQLTIKNERLYIEEYECLTEVLYLDAKDQYMTGRYLVDVEAAIELAALQLSVDFEPFESREKALDLIQDNIGLLVPLQHLSTIRSFRLFGLAMMECKSGLENALINEYHTVTDRFINNNERRKMFLTVLQKTPFYGAAFFNGMQDRRGGFLASFIRRQSHVGNVTVGINHEFITVVSPSRHELITCQPIANCSWSRSLDTNEKEIPSFNLQYPDGFTLSGDNLLGLIDENNLTNSVSVKFKKSSVECVKNLDSSNEIVQGTEVKQKSVAPLIIRQIFSKQAVMMEALLNSLYNELYSKINVVK